MLDYVKMIQEAVKMEGIKYFNDNVLKKATITPWWKLVLIKIFGEKMILCDSEYCHVFYLWRGKMYLANLFDVSTRTTKD